MNGCIYTHLSGCFLLFNSVSNVGNKPTIGDYKSIETHIFGINEEYMEER